MKALEALEGIRELLSSKYAWCVGAEARTELKDRVWPTCPQARSWSIGGAVAAVCHPIADPSGVMGAYVVNALFHCLPEEHKVCPVGPLGQPTVLLDDLALEEWNDGVATYEDVVALIEKTIERERSGIA